MSFKFKQQVCAQLYKNYSPQSLCMYLLKFLFVMPFWNLTRFVYII